MSNFWDMVLLMISTFFFIAYLIIMFQIVIDLFRDHELGGGSKVLWVIGLIFLPVLTAIVYIIARGKGMAERQQASVQQTKKLSVNSILSFRAAFHAVFGRTHGHTQAS